VTQSLKETGMIVMARPNPENPMATDLKILEIVVKRNKDAGSEKGLF
jgi:glutamine amidotransferase PdxT